VTRTLTRAARLEAFQFTVGTAIGMIRDLSVDERFLRETKEDPGRWDGLLDQLSAAMEESAPGSLMAILGALSTALDD
jgi:hypothetical protein